MKDIDKFKEDIQQILEKFQFDGETRRKFFSLLVEYAEEQQAGNPKKGNQDDHNQQWFWINRQGVCEQAHHDWERDDNSSSRPFGTPYRDEEQAAE